MFQAWDKCCWLLPATQRFVVLVEFLVRLKIRENTAWGRSDFFPTLFFVTASCEANIRQGGKKLLQTKFSFWSLGECFGQRYEVSVAPTPPRHKWNSY